MNNIWTMYAGQVNTYIKDYFAKASISNESVKLLQDSMIYSADNGGKRFRPILSLATAELLNKPIQYILPFACAVEFVHTYSLIHDDLPCMDNDDERRGRPTNHRVYGDAMALLAGDSLLTEAFRMVGLCNSRAENILRTINMLSEAAGMRGMIAGQVMDLSANPETLNLQDLIQIHKTKTGALIQVAVLGTAELCETNNEIKEYLKRYSENLGLAFQVKDDLLDGDKIENASFINFMGKNDTQAYLGSLTQNCIENLKPFGPKSQFLQNIAIFNLNRQL